MVERVCTVRVPCFGNAAALEVRGTFTGLERGDERLPRDADGWPLLPVFGACLVFFFVGGGVIFDIFEVTVENKAVVVRVERLITQDRSAAATVNPTNL